MKECAIEAGRDYKILRALQRLGFEGKYGKEWWPDDNVEGRDEPCIEGIPNEFG